MNVTWLWAERRNRSAKAIIASFVLYECMEPSPNQKVLLDKQTLYAKCLSLVHVKFTSSSHKKNKWTHFSWQNAIPQPGVEPGSHG